MRAHLLHANPDDAPWAGFIVSSAEVAEHLRAISEVGARWIHTVVDIEDLPQDSLDIVEAVARTIDALLSTNAPDEFLYEMVALLAAIMPTPPLRRHVLAIVEYALLLDSPPSGMADVLDEPFLRELLASPSRSRRRFALRMLGQRTAVAS